MGHSWHLRILIRASLKFVAFFNLAVFSIVCKKMAAKFAMFDIHGKIHGVLIFAAF